MSSELHTKDLEIKMYIKYSVHDMFLEQPSSGDAHNRKIGKPNNLKFWEQ
jgi:hypothetical protein